ncbi:Uncharacterized protein QTN25_007893 [Entamoeba marina]
MASILSWFTPNKSPKIILEETDNKLVYDDVSKRWVYENQLAVDKTSSTSPQPLSASPQNISSPLPPVSSPPVITNQPTNVVMEGRRPRYIDPFTQEVHQTQPPIVDVKAMPIA